MALVSAKDVAREVGLAVDELQKPCNSDHFPSLATFVREWQLIFWNLLNENDRGDVDRENPTASEPLKKVAALQKWKSRNGRGATYEVLIDALLSNGEKDQAELLCQFLAFLSDKRDTTVTDNEAEECESVIKFQCPCGECSLESYLQEGCPKSCIPYLGMTTLNKGDQENLNYILKKDTKKIMESFTDLSNRTCDSLVRHGVTVEKLVRVAVNSNAALRDELKKSKSIDEVFTDLVPEMSFFNHKLLANIIKELGDENDKTHLFDYSKEFEEFCKRKVFEVEPGRCTCDQRLSKLKGRKLFAIVLPTGEKTILQKLGDAMNIKETIADILSVPPATLHLHRIDRGSVILVFSVPDCIAEELFPLPKEKVALLKVKGIVLFVPKNLKSESNQMGGVLKPVASNADVRESSSTHTHTVPIGTPEELFVSHNLPTSAQLSWTPVPKDKQNDVITGYTVQVVGPDSTEKREISLIDGNATSYEVSNLRPYTEYIFSVSAMTGAGTGPAINVSSTTPQGAPSGKPGALCVHHRTATSAQLSWVPVPKDQQNGIITGYSAQVVGPDFTQEISITDATATSAEVSGLRPNAFYYFSISARTMAGTGPAASSFSITPQGVPTGTPGELFISHSLPSSAQISWTPVPKNKQNDVIIGYTVQVVGPNSTEKREIPVMDGNATSYEVSDLRPYTKYTFSVSAMTEAGTGPAISVSSTTPQGAPSGTPKWLTVRCSCPTSVHLSWGTVPEDQWNGIITGYSIQVEGPDTTRNIQTTITKWTLRQLKDDLLISTQTSEEISDLRPSTEYSFSVSAVTVAGSGPSISVSFIMPQEALSNTIGRIKTTQYHPISARISWGALLEDVITGYIVQIVGPDSAREIPVKKKHHTSVEASNLSPSTEYTFQVSAVKAPCGAPGELKISNILPTSARLSWTPVPEHKQNEIVTGYIVRVVWPDSMQEIPVMDRNATSYEVSDLKLGTEYTFSVRAITKAGIGLAKCVCSTTPQGAPSGTPEWLAVSCNCPTSVELSWGVVPRDQWNGIITGYMVQAEGPDTTRNIPITITTSDWMPSIHRDRLHSLKEDGLMSSTRTPYSFKKVSDLRPSTEYSFSVSAVTVAGSGPAIGVSFVMPQEALSNTIGRFKTGQYHPTSVQISWDAIEEDIVTGYIVQVVGPDSTQEIPVKNKRSTSVEASNLSPSTEYSFQINTMKLPCAPGELKISYSCPTSARLSWTPVPEHKWNEVITGYIVRVVKGYMYFEKEWKVMDPNATSYEVFDLRPYTEYIFSVSALTEAGTGPAISVCSSARQGAPSGTPKWLTVSCSCPTSVQLSWRAVPEDQWNGIITGYSIQVEGPDTTRNIQTAATASDRRIPYTRRLHFPIHSPNYEKVSDLRPSTEYSFSVSAVTEAGSGPAISVSFIMPQATEALSSTIGRLKTSQYHPTSGRISWEAVEDDDTTAHVTGYTVQVEGPDITQEIPITNTYITSVEISDLSPSTQYNFEVSTIPTKSRRDYYDRYRYHRHYWTCMSDPSETIFASYSWKSSLEAASGQNTTQYRMMLEYAPSLKDILADINVNRFASELMEAGLIMREQIMAAVFQIYDTKVKAAILISLITTKVYCNSENFAIFLDVLQKDEATCGHILAKMKGKEIAEPLSPLPSSEDSSLELSSSSPELIEYKSIWQTDTAELLSDDPLGLTPLPSYSDPSLQLGSTFQEFVKHKAEPTLASRASLPSTLPKGHVRLGHLSTIRWKDGSGRMQTFYLTEKIANKWRTIGELLNLTYSKLQSLADEYRQEQKECCRAVLGLWLDNPPPDYPATWRGLTDLLEDSQLGEVATELRTVLSKAIDL